ncbi:hypothetical protein CEXT_151091 [Caerostris extrusa]|uniref:Uncharacterized protein n=1 Tax=Caerostris extrusa TaxID=172846 RepID=A0AAV4TH63_CAEEX|nr:hypothetical protein CEXT_151091 [Caerostris extrusa]
MHLSEEEPKYGQESLYRWSEVRTTVDGIFLSRSFFPGDIERENKWFHQTHFRSFLQFLGRSSMGRNGFSSGNSCSKENNPFRRECSWKELFVRFLPSGGNRSRPLHGNLHSPGWNNLSLHPRNEVHYSVTNPKLVGIIEFLCSPFCKSTFGAIRLVVASALDGIKGSSPKVSVPKGQLAIRKGEAARLVCDVTETDPSMSSGSRSRTSSRSIRAPGTHPLVIPSIIPKERECFPITQIATVQK